MTDEAQRDEAGRFTGAFNRARSLYTQELADEICELMANGMTLREVCRREGMPKYPTVVYWATHDVDGFQERYMAARRIQASMWYDEMVDIADDKSDDWVETQGRDGKLRLVPNRDVIERARLRIDARKWVVARAHPEAYGEKTQIMHSGKIAGASQPVVVAGMTAKEAATAYAALVKGDD